MRNVKTVFVSGLLVLMLIARGRLWAEDKNEDSEQIRASETIQVTATKIPEAVEPEPASITIVTGDELRQTGAADLAKALSLVSGVSIARGGDGGPASSVPEMWGLREFDAFLLVVDNVPWGGAFNPALATLDLNDVERIEILRGPAPVMYGATSFVGVIHVIHRSATERDTSGQVYGGNFGTGGGTIRFALPSGESWKQTVSGNFDSVGFKDDRTDFQRGHVLYRGETVDTNGRFHLDVDLTFLGQSPASPHPRQGPELSTLVPLDANHNPSDSKQDENRYHFVAGYDGKLWGTDWSLLGAFTHSDRDITKGFLSDLSELAEENAAGYRQKQDQADLYLDTHFSWNANKDVHVLVGADYIYGKGEAESENFDYFVNLDGSNPPNSFDEIVQERPRLDAERNFFGLYTQVEWMPGWRWLVQGGLRFNSAHETREGEVFPGDAGGEVAEEEEGGADSRSDNRLSGTIGVSYLAWSNQSDDLWIFADYRNAFKPAAVDFGPEAEGEILEPETAHVYEGGMKGKFGNRLDWQMSLFRMDFKNLVTSTVVDGRPALINAGTQRFTGIEIEGDVIVAPDAHVKVGYSHHSATFRDFVQVFDGVPTQLAGHKLEMSPDHLAGIGFIYSPPKGVNGSFTLNYIGERFLNKRNTASAEGFATVDLGAGYRIGRNNFRLDILNVNDARDPISESELGDAQYYRQPARTFRFGWQFSL